jgi:hypothetical protein
MANRPPNEGNFFDEASRTITDISSGANKIANSFAAAGGVPADQFGFAASKPPTTSGASTRQGQVQPNIDAVVRRKIMRWLIPEQPVVEMYINPQGVDYQYKKAITPVRVKGGYVLQYWGEELTGLGINGTTGTSGIEGINVLMDVYRNEQLMFDPYALFLQAERDRAEQESFDDLVFGEGGPFGDNNSPILNALVGVTGVDLANDQTSNIINARNKPTLASMAFTVEMYWDGEMYRGYFENFTFHEKADNLGLFNYEFTFKVTQKRGFRHNFLAWHKHPSYGPSNWSAGGPPLSYSHLASEYQTTGQTGRLPTTYGLVGKNNQELNYQRDLAAINMLDPWSID